MSINWPEVLNNDWSPSKDSEEVSDPGVVNEVIEFLSEVGDFDLEPSISLLHSWATGGTAFELCKYSLSEQSLCELASSQLREHQKMWEVPYDNSNQRAYEFPIVLVCDGQVNYFKVVFYMEGKSTLTEVDELGISFHPQTK
jgi:hypothetical protein